MKKLFLVALSMLLMCMMVCNPYAAEAVQEITKYDTASLRDFPDLVNDGTVEEHKLLERRHEDEKEAMNMLAYKKESGENVAFLYHFDVKYKDKNGNIKDKSKEIVRDGLFSTTSFKTKDNDILSYFSVNDDGNVEVKTVYGEYSIVSVIENRNKGNRITAERDTEDTLTYRNAVDTGIHLMYEAEYNGVKEYIVLDSNSGNKFTFTMDFVGLTPQMAADNSVLLLNAAGETVLTIPPIYVEDSAVEKNSTYENAVKLTQVKGNRYLLEIAVDEDFLSSAETVYPVLVDPHITLSNANIDDTYVREGLPNQNYATRTQNIVGLTSLNNEYCAYIKFNNIDFRCSYHNILSAYYETYEVSGTNKSILIDVLPASATWIDTTLTWNNQPYYHEDIIAKSPAGGKYTAEHNNYIDYDEDSGIVRFYISNIVRAWAQGLPNYGIVLRSNYDVGQVELASSENSDYAEKVKLVIIYVNDSAYEVKNSLSVPSPGTYFYIKNKRSGHYLTATNTSSACNVYQSTFTGENNQQWAITPAGNDYYYIKLYNTSLTLDVYCGSNSPSGNTNGTNIQVHGINYDTNQQWRIKRNWNGTYQLLSALSNNTKGVVVYNASNASGTNCILYQHSSDFIYNDDWTLEPVQLGIANFYSFSDTNGSNDGLNSVALMEQAKQKAIAMGFKYSINYQDVSAHIARQHLNSTNLWFFRGHGGYSSMQFVSSTNWTITHLQATGTSTNNAYVSTIEDNDLNNLYLFAASCCSAGSSMSENSTNRSDLVGIIYRKGTHFAFASPTITYRDENNMWVEVFMDELANGKTYYAAMQEADMQVLEEYEYSFYAIRSCSRHYAGDSSIILYHSS